jgi:protein-tyrosine-phosphatase
MTAALLDHHAAGQVRVRSADSRPAAELNPTVITVMNEIGIDLSRAFPNHSPTTPTPPRW